jgi:hypothetical protein
VRVVVALAAAVLLAACAGRAGSVVLGPCHGGSLSGSFTAVRGSAGAGNIVYRLRLTNVSQRSCIVTGIPGLQLLSAKGRKLPTHTVPEMPGALTAVRVVLAPDASAAATARFSPDVPGIGEGHPGRPCEPVASKLAVTPAAGGTVVVPIRPPTSVCEHGRLSFRALAQAR